MHGRDDTGDRASISGMGPWSGELAINVVAALSPRECEVLVGVVDGKTSVEIAGQLDISHKRVEDIRLIISRKLGARNVADVVRIALTGA